jgi:hypothetical protein
MYFSLEGSAVVEFAGRRFPCDQTLSPGAAQLMRQLAGAGAAAGSSMMMTNDGGGGGGGSAGAGAGCGFDADALLSYFGFDRRGFWGSVGALAAYWAVLHVLCYAGLLLLARRR